MDFRVSLLVKPGDDLTITPSYFYQRITQGGYDTYDNPPGTSVPDAGPLSAGRHGGAIPRRIHVGSIVVRITSIWRT